MNFVCSVLLSLYLLSAEAKDVIITVGSGNGTSVFSPQTTNASSGDTIVFQFVNGTHSAVQVPFTVKTPGCRFLMRRPAV
ncbi:hypothetical protein Clacol_009181 [Clathrus columnatus]|uniref:Cupredoxin n=1 Tax=Clathrus columnatus TaxID=1419009 RepID=A0AAV5AJT0_9AGAM|nr:hypothetical protein Clacol_009181 [Clathrus columnatus]